MGPRLFFFVIFFGGFFCSSTFSQNGKITIDNFFKRLPSSKLNTARRQYRDSIEIEEPTYWGKFKDSVVVSTDVFVNQTTVLTKESNVTLSDDFEDPTYGLKNTISAILWDGGGTTSDARVRDIQGVIHYLQSEIGQTSVKKNMLAKLINYLIQVKFLKLSIKVLDVLENLRQSAIRGKNVGIVKKSFYDSVNSRYVVQKARVESQKVIINAQVELFSKIYGKKIKGYKSFFYYPIGHSYYKKALKKNLIKRYKNSNPNYLRLGYLRLLEEAKNDSLTSDSYPSLTALVQHQTSADEIGKLGTKQNNLLVGLNLGYEWYSGGHVSRGRKVNKAGELYSKALLEFHLNAFKSRLKVLRLKLDGLLKVHKSLIDAKSKHIDENLKRVLRIYKPNLVHWNNVLNNLSNYSSFHTEVYHIELEYLTSFYNLIIDTGGLSGRTMIADIDEILNK